MATLDYQNADDARKERREAFFRGFFGVRVDLVWEALAKEIDAELVKGKWGQGSRVVAKVPPWEVTLDSYVVDEGNGRMTQMRAPFLNPRRFRFHIYRKTFLTGLGKLLGMQDIAIGDPAFDDAFVIKASDKAMVYELLGDPTLRAMIDCQPDVSFMARDDEGLYGSWFPGEADVLMFYIPGDVTDIDRLKRLFELFAYTLKRLCEMGVAVDAPAGVKLQ